MATDAIGRPVKLRRIQARVISGESPAELEAELRAFFEAGGERVLLDSLEVEKLSVLVLFAESVRERWRRFRRGTDTWPP